MKTNSKSSEPFALITIGEQRSGKSYNIAQFAKNYSGTVLVYNYATIKDWKNYKLIEYIPQFENKEKNDKKQSLSFSFRYKGITYDFEKDFFRLFKNKKVLMDSIDDFKEQDNFFLLLTKINKVLQNPLLLIIDDSGAVLRQSLTMPLTRLLSKTRHFKIYPVLISHAFEIIPPRAYSYITHIRIFRTTTPPDKKRLENLPFKEYIPLIDKNLKDDSKSPKYTYFTLSRNGTLIKTILKNGKSENQHITNPLEFLK